MKVIFLDIDGVLNVYGEGRDKYGSGFHTPLVENLRYIIEQTDAKIVISSTWRFNGLQEMKDMWRDRGLPGDVIDITPDKYDELVICSSIDYEKVLRGHEIQYWLDTHNDIESYVIIDDDTDFLPSQKNNFVRTSGNYDHIDCYDIGYGLTQICAIKCVSILNKN